MRTLILAALLGLLGPVATAHAAHWTPPPAGAAFDYQIGEPYAPPAKTRIVTRDWYAAKPTRGVYGICYVNAFQTQPDERGSSRPDERSAWPQGLLLTRLGPDPGWEGEYLVDLSNADKRRRAAAWVAPMIRTCARKGFRAVEFDNLDSWTRFDRFDTARRVPFGKGAAIAYAAALTRRAHALGLAAGQKNTAELTRRQARRTIGFDFAVVEECGETGECAHFTSLYRGHVLAIEYTAKGFAAACAKIGARASVIRRDRNVTAPGSSTYVYRRCAARSRR